MIFPKPSALEAERESLATMKSYYAHCPAMSIEKMIAEQENVVACLEACEAL